MKRSAHRLNNTHALVFSPGLPGGGVATVNWLLERGATVTVAGPDERQSAPIIRRVREHLKKIASDGKDYDRLNTRLTWIAGRPSDALKAGMDLVISGPGDEAVLFYRAWPRKIIGIAGTVGKTTTATWAAHLIGDAVLAGHHPDRPLMTALASRAKVAVIRGPAPYVVSTDESHDAIPDGTLSADFADRWGTHNVANARTAVAAARSVGVPWATIKKRLTSLPQVPCRQQVVYHDRTLTVVDDTAAATPEGGIAALERWGGPNCVLITGGDDSRSDYRAWADTLPRCVTVNNTIFIAGSATDKMRAALGPVRARGIRTYDSLERCWRAAKARAGKFISAVIVFSPAAESSERFDVLVRRE